MVGFGFRLNVFCGGLVNDVEGVGLCGMGLRGGLRVLEKVVCRGGGIVLGIGGLICCPMV